MKNSSARKFAIMFEARKTLANRLIREMKEEYVLHAHQPKRNRLKQKARQERPARKVPKGKVRKGRVRP